MKRDWGLIRDLLEHLESLGFGQHWEARELPGHCREAVAFAREKADGVLVYLDENEDAAKTREIIESLGR
ncbi:hypothetical protein K3X19_15120, partial [Listeria monocytogenes]|nr:hypothetical protein [Listeria monocytogenes]